MSIVYPATATAGKKPKKQEMGSVRAFVSDSRGRYLEGAHVVLYRGDQIVAEGITEGSGVTLEAPPNRYYEYRPRPSPPPEYHLVVQKEGFFTHRARVDLDDSERDFERAVTLAETLAEHFERPEAPWASGRVEAIGLLRHRWNLYRKLNLLRPTQRAWEALKQRFESPVFELGGIATWKNLREAPAVRCVGTLFVRDLEMTLADCEQARYLLDRELTQVRDACTHDLEKCYPSLVEAGNINFQVRFIIGMLHWRSERWAEAEDAFEEIIEDSTGWFWRLTESWYGRLLGLYFEETAKGQEARTEYLRSILPDVYIKRGEARRMMGKMQPACADFEQACEEGRSEACVLKKRFCGPAKGG